MVHAAAARLCEHCLLPVADREAVYDDLPSGRKVFCCRACSAVYRMITEEGLGDFYTRRDWKTYGIPGALQDTASRGDDVPDREPDALLPFINGEGDAKEADLMIDGIRCASCVWLNEKVLERTGGVLSARINFATHRLLITWDGTKTTLAKIISRIRAIGYLARPYTPAAHERELKRRNADLLARLGTAFFFSMQLMVVSFGLYAGYFQGIDVVTKRWLEFFASIVSTPVLFYSGRPFFTGAYRGLRNRTLTMDALVVLGAFSAYALSVHHMLGGGEVYFDTSSMIITLVLLGRYLENSARQRASQAVARLLSLQPRDARLIRNGERVTASVDAVRKGDRLEVRPGEKIPLDGIVREGSSEVDESLVTGESRPIEKTPGSGVIGGSLNGLGTIIMEVGRVGRETVLARIAQLVEHAQASSAPVQRIADRVSAYFIPLVLAAATATFLFWSYKTGGRVPLLNAVAVLVIACPCALGLATPLAVLAGTGNAARKGILIKGGDVLEKMSGVDAVIFDKTGTITTGKPSVVEIKGAGSGGRDPGEKNEIVRIAASAEQGSEHLLGAAIVRFAQEQGISLLKAENVRTTPGQGVSGVVEGERVLVGKRSLLEKKGIFLYPGLIAEADGLERSGRTVVFVAKGKELLGVIGLLDSPKEDAGIVVEQLKRMNITVTMITGDNRATADAVAEKTGIAATRAGVLPSGKSEEVGKLRAGGKVVAMVGDGINDAPALAAADVGIAMAAGSDIAIESADVVLMRSDLGGVVRTVELSRKTLRIIKQNLFWAFFYNAAAVPLAMAGALHPVVAAAAMAASSAAVVMNSLRLR